MARQTFDHSEFIHGQLRRHQQVGWDEQVVLGQGPRSIWLMQAKHIDHTDGSRGVELQVQHYRKTRNTQPFDKPVTSFTLREGAVQNLAQYLQKQRALAGVDLGEDYVAIPVSGKMAGLSARELGMVSEFLCAAVKDGQITELVEGGLVAEEVLTGLGVASQHFRHKKAIQELEALLDEGASELDCQQWFEGHPWVFGIEYVEHVSARRIGLHEITDVLLKTVDGYLDIFELKRPDTQVLNHDRSRDNYYFSQEVSSAISQCANYMKTVEENRHLLAQVEHLPFLKPRGRIVVGRSADWNQTKKDGLRTLNSALHFIEVLTYDQVLSMATQLVGRYETDLDAEKRENDEQPF